MALYLINIDCMELMAQYPDKHFDLAIVDPPYGIGQGGHKINSKTVKKDGSLIYKTDRRNGKQIKVKPPKYHNNYKVNGETDQSDCELAYTSFGSAVRQFRFMWNGFTQGKSVTEGWINQGNKQLCELRCHPNQKPIALYSWLLHNYAKEGDKILDTHLGSGSIAIACHDYGFDLTGSELDKDYYDAMMKRVNGHISQQKLFV